MQLLPNSQITFILNQLIHKGSISERETNFNGYRSRKSELINKYGLRLIEVKIPFKNVFGHKSYYTQIRLDKRHLKKASSLYIQLVFGCKKIVQKFDN